MPSAVIRGDPLWLNCSFDLESDDLYSVKWYKNHREFFRYLPNENPPGQAYRLSGVYVDTSRTSVGSLYLKETDLKSEGLYACEVSADAPSFQTVRSEKELKVYVLPKKGPEIRGTKPHYRVGDVVNVTCHAGATKPPAVLTWYINGEEVPPQYEKMYPIFRDRDQLYHSSLGMTFTAESRHFTYGIMKLKCTATVSEAYSLSSEEIVAAQDAKSTGTDDDKPSITGGQASYHVGDLVNVTCSYSRYGRPVELQWHLNDKELPAPTARRHLRPWSSFSEAQQSLSSSCVFDEHGLKIHTLSPVQLCLVTVFDNHASAPGKFLSRVNSIRGRCFWGLSNHVHNSVPLIHVLTRIVDKEIDLCGCYTARVRV
ncbi:hypothetical protein V5799_006341 [Amblyomma americanum]|uniref:Ig-like domain-containing protein n=1 Tax=Amblyomma americanum TaxID=6943 RepID=A0AAQ4DWN8_AMBAM